MQHLDEGLLHELLDGEISSSDLPPIQAHLAGCPECRARLEEARGFAAEADRLVETIKLAEQDPPRRGVAPLRPTPRRWGRDLAWAATVVVAVGAGYVARGGGPSASLSLDDSAVATPVASPILPAAEPDRSTTAPADRAAESETRANAPASPPRQRSAGGSKEVAKASAAAPAERKDSTAVSAALDTAQKNRRKLGDTKLALEELVVTGVAEKAVSQSAVGRAAAVPAPPSAQGARAPAPRLEAALAANELRLDQMGKLSAGPKREGAPVEITFPEALRRLSGTLRLIEGLVPLRLEIVEPDVRVVYPLSSGELLLEQRLVDGLITWRLVAPGNFPADSLERLRARVRE